MPRVLGIVLAGGEGKRLMPLTEDRAKPAVPFGGLYRLIELHAFNAAGDAAKAVEWITEPTTVLDDSNPPFYRWFVGGEVSSADEARAGSAGRDA